MNKTITVILYHSGHRDRDGDTIVETFYDVSVYSQGTEIADIINESGNIINKNVNPQCYNSYRKEYRFTVSELYHGVDIEILFNGGRADSDEEYELVSNINDGLSKKYREYCTSLKDKLILAEQKKQEEYEASLDKAKKALESAEYANFLILRKKYDGI